MKKTILIALLVAFAGIGVASAETSSMAIRYTSSEADFRESTNPLGAINLRNNQDRLLKAIYQRQKKYFQNRYRAEVGDFDNVYRQRDRLRYAKRAINVNDETTELSRTGALQDHSRTRSRNGYRIQRSNAKQTFKARAICYYVEGGDANADCLKSGVIDGQRHRVVPKATRTKQAEVGAINLQVRDMVRLAAKEMNEQTADRVNTYRQGSYDRMYLAPFVRQLFVE